MEKRVRIGITFFVALVCFSAILLVTLIGVSVLGSTPIVKGKFDDTIAFLSAMRSAKSDAIYGMTGSKHGRKVSNEVGEEEAEVEIMGSKIVRVPIDLAQSDLAGSSTEVCCRLAHNTDDPKAPFENLTSRASLLAGPAPLHANASAFAPNTQPRFIIIGAQKASTGTCITTQSLDHQHMSACITTLSPDHQQAAACITTRHPCIFNQQVRF
jgi:hypothetical protein